MHAGARATIVLLAIAGLCPAQDAKKIFARAQAALNQGDLDMAERDFNAVLAQEPNSLPARANLGVVYMRRKQWARALDQFRRAEKLAPGNPGIALDEGLAYFHEGDYARASPYFEHVLNAEPSSQQARYLLALCEVATEKYANALAHLKPLWPSESEKMPYLYMVALSADKAKDERLEQQALEQMYRVGRGTAEYHLFLGRAWLMRQRDADAVAELKQALTMNPQLPFAHFTLGDIYARTGQYPQAAEEFKADAAVEPDLTIDYEELGDVYAKLDQPTAAEAAYRRAIELDSGSARAHLGLARIEKTRGNFEAALVQLNAAEKAAPESASLHYLRGQVLHTLQREREAQAEFAQSARLRQSQRDYLEEQISGHSGIDAAIALH